MRDEIIEVRKEVKKLKEETEEKTFAMSILDDYKKSNKRMFIIILVLIALWGATIGIFVYYITHYTTEETKITETAETDDGGNACVGDNCNNGEINYGKGN